MPLYEYECKRCHHRFERIQKFSDPLVRKCPKCKVGRVEKLLSAPAVQFKGTGWYVTDYGGKKGGGEKSEGEKADSAGKAAEKSAASSDKSDKSDKKDSGKSSGKSGGSGKSSKS